MGKNLVKTFSYWGGMDRRGTTKHTNKNWNNIISYPEDICLSAGRNTFEEILSAKHFHSFPRTSCTFVCTVRYEMLWYCELLCHSRGMRLCQEWSFWSSKKWNPGEKIRSMSNGRRHEYEQRKKESTAEGFVIRVQISHSCWCLWSCWNWYRW